MPDAGGHLIPVPKTVQRGVSTFVETYWVKAEQVRGEVKAAQKMVYAEDIRPEMDRVIKELGGDSVQADRWIAGWEFGQWDVNTEMASAVLSSIPHPPELVRDTAGFLQVSQETVERSMQQAQQKVTTSTVAAVAAASQSMYDSPTVTVWRGVYGQQADDIRAAMKSGQKSIEVATHVMASFTEDPVVASGFAYHKGGEHSNGVILKTEIPRASIVISHRAFTTLGPEKELVVATAGSITVSADDIVMDPIKTSMAGSPAWQLFALDYNPDQPRDDHGRWGEGGGGDAQHPKPKPPTESERRLDKSIRQAIKQGGATINPKSGRMVVKGYAVSTEKGLEHKIPIDEYRRNGIQLTHEFRERNREALARPGAKLGVWYDTNKESAGYRHVFLDVSTVVHTLDRAVRLGHGHNQLAIWDITHGRTHWWHGEVRLQDASGKKIPHDEVIRHHMEVLKTTEPP